MATAELRTGIGGVTLQGEDSDDGAGSVLQRACLCLNGAELLVGFVGSRARLCALAPRLSDSESRRLDDRVAGQQRLGGYGGVASY